MLQARPANAPATIQESSAEQGLQESTKAPELPKWRRYVILFIVAWNTLVVTSTSTSLLIATPEISEEIKTTPEILNITNAGVLIAMGCSSLLWSPVAELTSRRIAYNTAMFVMTAGSIGTALAPNMGVFTASRLITAFTGTSFMVFGQTIIADIFPPLYRGRAIGCLMVGSVSGTALGLFPPSHFRTGGLLVPPGPCIGGILLTYSNWRSIYWLQVAQAGLGFTLSVLLIPSIQSEVAQLHEKREGKLSLFQVIKQFNPSRVFKLYLRPHILLTNTTCGFLAITQFGLISSVRHIINPRFNLTTPLIAGMIYIAPGIGFIVGSLVGGRFSDRTVKRYIEKRHGLRLPKDRLNCSLIHLLFVLPTSCLLYGWSLDQEFGGLALPIVMAFWIGTGLQAAWNGLNTYAGGK